MDAMNSPVPQPAPTQSIDLSGVFNYLGVNNDRPAPNWRTAIAAVGGAVLAISIMQLTQSDKAAVAILLSLLIAVAGYTVASFTPERFRPIGVGMLAVGIIYFVTSLAIEIDKEWLLYFIGALISLAVYLAPGTKGHPLFLTGSFIFLLLLALTSVDDQTGNLYSVIALLFSAVFFAATWYLDSVKQTRIALSFTIAGIVALFLGLQVSSDISTFGILGRILGANLGNVAPGIGILGLAVGGLALYVGYTSQRRGTAWSGAAAILLSSLALISDNNSFDPSRWYALIGLLVVAPVLLAIANLDDIKKQYAAISSNSVDPAMNQPSTGIQGFNQMPQQQVPHLQDQTPQTQNPQGFVPQGFDPQANIVNPAQQQQTPAVNTDATQITGETPGFTPNPTATPGASQDWFTGGGEQPAATEATQVSAQQPAVTQQDAATASAATNTAPSTVTPNWYSDPTNRFEYRWHDGNTWTQHVSTAGNPTVDPKPV